MKQRIMRVKCHGEMSDEVILPFYFTAKFDTALGALSHFFTRIVGIIYSMQSSHLTSPKF
jgi:hypothetical protein